jgi:hypothetical protein
MPTRVFGLSSSPIFVECSAVTNRDVHHAEIIRAGVAIVDRVAGAAGRFVVDRVLPCFASGGQRGDHSGGLDTRGRAELREKTIEESLPGDRLGVQTAGEADVDGENTFGVESFVDLQQPVEAGGEKAGNDQQCRA